MTPARWPREAARGPTRLIAIAFPTAITLAARGTHGLAVILVGEAAARSGLIVDRW
jgi:hypothetical protein